MVQFSSKVILMDYYIEKMENNYASDLCDFNFIVNIP